MAGFFKKLFRRGGSEHQENHGEHHSNHPHIEKRAPEHQESPNDAKHKERAEALKKKREKKAEHEAKMQEWETRKQQVEAENEAIKARREAVKNAAKDAIAEVKKILDAGNLSESDKGYYEWVKQSAENAYNQSLEQNKDSYTVKVLDKEGRTVIKEREEGMPVEELINIVERVKAKAERQKGNKEKADEIHQRFKIQLNGRERGDNEQQEKLAWHHAWENILPATHQMRIDAQKLAESWERESGQTYDDATKKEQLGQALKQVLLEEGLIEDTASGIKLKAVADATPEEVIRLGKIAEVLGAESKKYFDKHQTQGAEQNPFTTREAAFIAEDVRYRTFLIKKYRDKRELPNNFGNLDKQNQDYQLAMLALRDRKVLDLPKETEFTEEAPILVDDVEVPAPVIKIHKVNLSEIAQRMAKSLADARLEAYYENPAGAGWFKRKMIQGARSLTEKWNRIKFYDDALKEIMEDQNLLKAMEARAMQDQHLAGKSADDRGVVKRSLGIGRAKAAHKIHEAREHAGYKPKIEDYQELIDSVMAEYDSEVVNNKELGEQIKVSENLNGLMAELFVKHQKGEFADRAAFDAYVKEHIKPVMDAETSGKKYSKDDEKAKKAGDLLFETNFWQMAEKYKGDIKEMVDDYKAKCEKEGKEFVEAEAQAHVRGLLAFDLQLGLKDRDMANNKPDSFMEEYAKYKSGSGVFKFFNQGGYKRLLFNPLTYGMVAGAGGGVASRIVANAVSRKGLLAAGAVLGYGAMASFAAPIVVGAGMGAYWAYKRRKEQAEADIRQAQRYEALGGSKSTTLDAKKTGYWLDQNELRNSAVVSSSHVIGEMKHLLENESLSDEEKHHLAAHFARLDFKASQFADLFKEDDGAGKKTSSTQVSDSQLRILRKKLTEKFNLTGEEWDHLVEHAGEELVKDSNKAEKNIQDFMKWEARKAGAVGFIAGTAGALVGQKLMYMAMDKVGMGQAMDFMADKFKMPRLKHYFYNHGTTYDRLVDYFDGNHSQELALFPLEETGVHTKTTRKIPGAPRSVKDWLSVIKGNHTPGVNVDRSTTMGFYENNTPMEVDPGTGKLIGADLNELRFQIEKVTGGKLVLKTPMSISSLAEYGSFHGDVDADGIAPGSNLDRYPNVKDLLADGKLKVVLIPKAGQEAIFLDIDPKTGNIEVPAELENLFDKKTGRCLADTYGTARVEDAGGGKGKNVYWLNSDRNPNAEIDFGMGDEQVIVEGEDIDGKGYDMAFGTPLWRRKKYNKAKKDDGHGHGDHGHGDHGHGGHEHGAGHGADHGRGAGGADRNHGTEDHGAAGGRNAQEQNPVNPENLNAESVKAKEANKKVLEIAGDASKTDQELDAAMKKALDLRNDPAVTAQTKQELSKEFLDASAQVRDRLVASIGRVKKPDTTPEPQLNPVATNRPTPDQPGARVEAGQEGAAFETKLNQLKGTYGDIHFVNAETAEMSEADKLTVLQNFEKAFAQLAEDDRKNLLNRNNRSRAGTALAKGLILSFPQGQGKIGFGAQDRLNLTVRSSASDIKRFLEARGNVASNTNPGTPRQARQGGGGGNPRSGQRGPRQRGN